MKKYWEVIEHYIRIKQISIKEFSRLCRISNVTVYNLLSKVHDDIHSLTAYKIELGTKGVIRYEELTDIPRKNRYVERFKSKNLIINE